MSTTKMTEPLSPAAQAVLHGFWDAPVSPTRNVQIAAALRAAADHLRNAYANEECIDSADDFLDGIAAELEATNG